MEKHMEKIIFIDVDGTLVDYDTNLKSIKIFGI